MFCKNCGTEVDDRAVRCPNCGENLNERIRIDDGIKDEGGFLWGLLGCCVPIAGLILYLIWKDTKPKTAKAAGKGALIAVILLVLYYIVIFAIALIGGVAASQSYGLLGILS